MVLYRRSKLHVIPEEDEHMISMNLHSAIIDDARSPESQPKSIYSDFRSAMHPKTKFPVILSSYVNDKDSSSITSQLDSYVFVSVPRGRRIARAKHYSDRSSESIIRNDV
jgi:hypothetical protein